MSFLTDNPFAILTGIVAPAVLTNACSVLTLGTGNRIARVVDRTRAVTAEIATLKSGTPEYNLLMNQLERLQTRAQMLMRALRRFYASLGSFAAAALIAVIGSALASFEETIAFQAAAVLGLVVGIYGVGSLVSGCTTMVRETRLALQYITEDAQLARSRFAQSP